MNHAAKLITVLVGLALSTSCTGSSSDAAKKPCAALYPTTTAVQKSVAGDLRHFALRGKAPGHFAALPDDVPVTLCLVPDGSGRFTVYGVPQGGGMSEALWSQDDGHRFTRPI